jgi:NhaP-type Na+/H+ or K+/H+ antiporter
MSETLAAALALIGIVILVSSLLSGIIERTGLPQVAIFLLLGLVVGPAGLRLVDLTLESPTLQWIATLALVLVLFTDAIVMDFGEVRHPRRLLFMILGPATLIPAVIIGLAAWLLLGLSPLLSSILGAALASTDPVMLRGLIRRSSVPAPVREALRLEGGINDVVLLPIIVLCILALTLTDNLAAELGRHGYHPAGAGAEAGGSSTGL